MLIEHSTLIAAPVEAVYAISQDYAVRYAWDPFPEHIALMDGATSIQPGVRAQVKAKSGLRMEVQFVQVNPPATAAITMTHGPVFLEKFAGSWIFKLHENGVTVARFRYMVKFRTWALPWLAEAVARLYFSRAVQKRLHGLKIYCESSCTR